MHTQEPIQRKRLSEEVASRIEAMISSGRLLTGDQLPSERELMRTFGVGRPSIREALFALQAMGLVETINGERGRVVRPSPERLVRQLSGMVRHIVAEPEGMQWFQNARSLFETSIARYAARHATSNDIARLESALHAFEESSDDVRAAVRTDVAFHMVLAGIPGNPIFTAVHAALAEWLIEQPIAALHSAGALPVAYREHKRIYEAIAARDPDEAEQAMADHMREVARFYWELRGVPGEFVEATFGGRVP